MAQTPNPKPQTPNPKPQTLNPKPQTKTPNPKTETRNPKPKTRNPKAKSQKQVKHVEKTHGAAVATHQVGHPSDLLSPSLLQATSLPSN